MNHAPRYLLDTQVVSWFLHARKERELTAAAGVVACSIVDEVRDELARDPTRGDLFKAWLPESGLEVLCIEPSSEESRFLSKLQPPVPKPRNRGERASIAIAAIRPNLIFAGMDKASMWLAFRELWTQGERMISFPVFLRRLVEAEALPPASAAALMKRSSQLLPTWWSAWLARR